jgi:hypothetical protein
MNISYHRLAKKSIGILYFFFKTRNFSIDSASWAAYIFFMKNLTNRQSTVPARASADLIEIARASIRAKAGYRIDDSARFYLEVAEGKKIASAVQLQARARLDKLLDLEPRPKQQQSDISAVADIVKAVQSLAGKTGTRVEAAWSAVDECDTCSHDLTAKKGETGENGVDYDREGGTVDSSPRTALPPSIGVK